MLTVAFKVFAWIARNSIVYYIGIYKITVIDVYIYIYIADAALTAPIKPQCTVLADKFRRRCTALLSPMRIPSFSYQTLNTLLKDTTKYS